MYLDDLKNNRIPILIQSILDDIYNTRYDLYEIRNDVLHNSIAFIKNSNIEYILYGSDLLTHMDDILFLNCNILDYINIRVNTIRYSVITKMITSKYLEKNIISSTSIYEYLK